MIVKNSILSNDSVLGKIVYTIRNLKHYLVRMDSLLLVYRRNVISYPNDCNYPEFAHLF